MIYFLSAKGFKEKRPRHNEQHPKYFFYGLDNEEKCIRALEVYLEFGNGFYASSKIRCPKCNSKDFRIVKRGKFKLFQCKCRKQFSVLSCTPFKGLKINIFKIFHLYYYYSQRSARLTYIGDPHSPDKTYKMPYAKIARATGVDPRTVKKVFGIFEDPYKSFRSALDDEGEVDEDRPVIYFSRSYIKQVKMAYRRYYIRGEPRLVNMNEVFSNEVCED